MLNSRLVLIGLLAIFAAFVLYFVVFVNSKLSLSLNIGDEKKLKEYENTANELKNSLETVRKQLNEKEQIIANLNKEIETLKNQSQPTQNIKYDLSHLKQDSQFVFGPIQDDEALLLYSLVKVIRPKLVVEFGFSHGVSATNWLKALDQDAKFYSYDISEWNPQADAYKDPRFKFYLKSQTEFNSTDVDNKTIDIVYFDDGHIFDINTKAFQIIINHVTPNAIIAVHDTGLHYNELGNCACDFEKKCGGAHQKDERLFINWIIDNYPEWQIVELHSFNIFRHGLTLLQKKYKLSVTDVDTNLCAVA